MDTRQVVARFEAERQALALMDHPNIARVLDGGTTDSGRPYFVMEFVIGVPITEYCDQNQVPIRQRLDLFVSVCQAVQHAHQKGIIHRDIKPSNVLVVSHDGTPVVKVIDFGVAKAIGQQLTDKTIYTQISQMVGTPLYMSPEQAGMSGLDVDTRSDIYSLGVLLYELLTGTTPFDKERLREVGYDEMRRIIRDEEPPKPSTRISTLGQVAATVSTQRRSEPKRLSQQLRGELDWIVMKALEKDRNRRYKTAYTFAADVQRYLHDEPVTACPPSSWYRFRKFARRNRAVLATTLLTAAALLTTIVALGISNVAISRKEKELAQVLDDKDAALKAAQASEAAAQTQKRLARQNLRKACDAVDQMLNRVAEERLLHAPRMTATRLAILQDAGRFYEEFVRQEGEASEPWLRLEVGQAYHQPGGVMSHMGQWNRAMEASQQAITLLDQLRTEVPSEHTCRRILADALTQLGTISRMRGRHDEAEKLFEKALDLYSQLAVEVADEAGFRIAYANCQVTRSWALMDLHRFREAEKASRQGLALVEKILAADPMPLQGRMLLGGCQSLLGEILLATGRFHEAEPILRAALETRQKLKAESPADPNLCGSVAENLAILAELLQKTGRRAKALEMRRQALVLIDKLVEDFPAVLWHRESQQKCLVAIVIAEEQPHEAEQLYQRAVASLERLIADWPRMLEYRYQLAGLHLERGNFLRLSLLKKAEQAYRRALPLAEKLVAEDSNMYRYRGLLVECRKQLALVLSNTGRSQEAKDICEQTLPLAEKLAVEFPYEPDHKRLLGETYMIYGLALKGAGRPREAEKAFRQAATVSEQGAKNFPTNSSFPLRAALAQRELEQLLAEDASRVRESEDADRREGELLQKAVADFPDDLSIREHLAHYYRLRGLFLQRRGRLPEAEKAFRQAVQTLEKLLADFPGAQPKQRALLGDTYAWLGSLLAAAGRREEAHVAMRKARDFPPHDAGDYNHLAEILATCSDPEVSDGRRAVELARKAVELAPVDGNYWSTLGLAYCYTADWKEAIRALEKSNALIHTGSVRLQNAFCLAIARGHLGHKEQARHWYSQAVAWMEKYAPKNAEIRRLRAETEKSLGKLNMLDGKAKNGR